MQLDSSKEYLFKVHEGEYEVLGIKYKESENGLLTIGNSHKTQRYIEYTVNFKGNSYILQYSRGTRQILDDIKLQLGINNSMVYNKKNITVVEVSNNDLYSRLKDDTWNKIVRGLEKAYSICFNNESDVSDINISQEIDRYIEKSKLTKAEVLKYNRNLRKKYINIQSKELTAITDKEMSNLLDDVIYELRTSYATGIFDRKSKFYYCELSYDFITRLRILVDMDLNMGIAYSCKDGSKLVTIVLTGIAYEVKSQYGKEPKNVIFVEDIDKFAYLLDKPKQIHTTIIPEDCNALIPIVIILKHNSLTSGLDSIEDYDVYEDFNNIPIKYRHVVTCLLGEIAIRESSLPELLLIDTTRDTMGFKYFQGMLLRYNKEAMRKPKYTSEDFVIDMSTNLLRDID